MTRWRSLPSAVRDDVAILRLPMTSRKENALIVNALQRCASVVVQNSLKEGFGLTATEAMWKGAPLLATRASGLRAQVRDGLEGRLVDSAEDAEAIAQGLREMLTHDKRSDAWANNARSRVANEFLIFHQVQRWLEVLAELG